MNDIKDNSEVVEGNGESDPVGDKTRERIERKRKEKELHERNMARMKAAKKKKAAAGVKRAGGFDRTKLSANFMANNAAAKNVDVAAGMRIDFDNPEQEQENQDTKQYPGTQSAIDASL